MNGYLHVPGYLIRTISIGDPAYQPDKTKIRIVLDGTSSTLVLDYELANQLITMLGKRLYDDGAMDTATADTLSYLTAATLMDSAQYAEIVAMSSGEDF